ncbi:UDP-galactopyranose mutase [Prosthecodimorpha staleyi]|uniref:UDP-galactopyranose mutase n=1 Tax=Prosthecodimorpha staleyi TaxID=2840188 RepID=A0A947GJW3_9HYPH|nr:UDP-galactopyranose mutase [Prosthecodimorpha staleyi]MBT9292549.1 UDP-galactopyranose mutase [Prosthecodimorpha staleyi]
MKVDCLVVGAGFAGAVCAERLAASGRSVLVIDRRNHIGGNAHDRPDAHGILVHPYGPHIFHTNAERIFAYLSRFTDWRFYEHRVLASVDGRLLPIPINRTTINGLYGWALDEAGIRAHLDAVRVPIDPIRTSEDAVLASVGTDLCDRFFRGYTRKQWGLDLADLSASVAARIPTRTGDDDRYFTDRFQFMPAAGYTRLFEAMLASPRITVRLATDFFQVRDAIAWDHLIFTGPLDGFYGHRYGRLPYRSLRFEHEHLAGIETFQPVGQVNYPNDHAFTRITEFKHLTGQQAAGTSIMREYPCADGEPFYPVPRPENEALAQRYRKLAAAETRVSFVGRLAEYRYYNMDQVVGAALKTVADLGA